MRWFKKKPEPFDDHYSIHVETPPSPVDQQHFLWTVPNWYYARLVCLQFEVDIFRDALNLERLFNFYVQRGGVTIYRWCHSIIPAYNMIHYAMQYPHALPRGSHRGGILPVVPPLNPWQEPLPVNLNLYPHDVLHVEMLWFDHNDVLSNFVLTLHIWELS